MDLENPPVLDRLIDVYDSSGSSLLRTVPGHVSYKHDDVMGLTRATVIVRFEVDASTASGNTFRVREGIGSLMTPDGEAAELGNRRFKIFYCTLHA